MLYASYGTGYKSPGVNADIFLFSIESDITGAPTDSETSNNSEIGFRGTYETFRFDFTWWDTEFDGFQTNIGGLNAGIAGVNRIAVGDVKTTGIETNFAWVAGSGLSFAGGINSLETEILSDVESGGKNLKGGSLPLAPELKYTLAANYHFLLGLHPASITLTYVYTDEVIFNLNQNPEQSRDDFSVANLSFVFSSPKDTWDINLFIRNLFDEQSINGIGNVSSTQGGGNMATIPRDYERYFGTSFSMKF